MEPSRNGAMMTRKTPASEERAILGLSCGCLIVAVIGGAVLLMIFGGRGGETTKQPGSETIMAQIMAERFVKRQLRAPSTAEFGGEITTYIGDNRYRVAGYVDAQNAFGAKIRAWWTCTVEQTVEGDWAARQPCKVLE